MPVRALRICSCGNVVASGAVCPCRREQRARADAQRPSARERGYDTRWQQERAAFLGLNARCARCSGAATVVDHIIPHRGDMRLFWDRSNWQRLCVTCHARWKQSQEKRRARA
jgi:5-methylcytosine-specific restriction protein A